MGSDFSKEDCFHFPTMDKRNLDTLRDNLRNYNPPEGCVDCLNILLFGMVGAGKSSTINTFLSALDPQGTTVTCVPTGDNPESLTPELRCYRAEKLRFWDSAGWNVEESSDQTKRVDSKKKMQQKKRVLQMILEGRVPSGTDLHSFNPDSDISSYPVIPENVIHGVALLFDINTMDSISDNKMEEFQQLQTIVALKYVHRVVIGTKFELLGIPEEHNAWIYQFKPLQQKFEKLSAYTGMERRSMFVVSNQWRGGQIEMIRCILALYVLDNMFDRLAAYTGMERRSMFVISNQWRGGQIEMIRCIQALYVLDNMVRNIDRFLKAV